MTDTAKTVFITGASGMIGAHTVKKLLAEGFNVIGADRCEGRVENENYTHVIVDLSVKEDVRKALSEHRVDRVIHLAAIAHAFSNGKITYEQYYKANVECAINVFSSASEKGIPVLFISTADVYGFVKGQASAQTPTALISDYAKTKALAEKEITEICRESGYDIFRFAPVYTDEIKRDIQKRYYLKYPNLAYIIGKGAGYEFLHIDLAAEKMADWVKEDVKNEIRNIKNKELINTATCIEDEKKQGRAVRVLRFPRWMVCAGFYTALALTGKNKYTYLINKVVNPLRTE